MYTEKLLSLTQTLIILESAKRFYRLIGLAKGMIHIYIRNSQKLVDIYLWRYTIIKLGLLVHIIIWVA